MAQPRRASSHRGRPLCADAYWMLTALLAIVGLLTGFATASPAPCHGAPDPRSRAVDQAHDDVGLHADDACAAPCGTRARVCREETGERFAPPSGGALVPPCPVIPLPAPAAGRPVPWDSAASPDHTAAPPERAPPPSAGT